MFGQTRTEPCLFSERQKRIIVLQSAIRHDLVTALAIPMRRLQSFLPSFLLHGNDFLVKGICRLRDTSRLINFYFLTLAPLSSDVGMRLGRERPDPSVEQPPLVVRIGRRIDQTAVLLRNLGIRPFLAAHDFVDQERVLVVVERRLVLVVHLQHPILAVDVGQ